MINVKENLSFELVNELLIYDSLTGTMYWKERDEKYFKDGLYGKKSAAKSWNTKFAGKIALNAIGPNGYRCGAIFHVNYYLHRVAWLLHYKEWPSNHIDHINGDRADNRIENLRDIKPAINHRNKVMYPSNTSGANGVSLTKNKQRYQARIFNTYIGTYDTFEEAVEARENAEKLLGFSDRHGEIQNA